jgi:hypothetical protein
MRQTEPPVEQPNFLRQLAPFLGVKEYAPGDSYADKVSKNWASNPMNPVPQTWNAISEGRAPTGGEMGVDAAFLAGAGLIGAAARPVADAARRTASRVVPTFQSPEAHYSSLMRRIMKDPDTALSTVRSMDSVQDIVGGSGLFRSSRELGTSGAQGGTKVSEVYNPLRDVFESNMGMGADTAYGAFTSPVLSNQPAPFPLFRRGRENFLNYQRIARMMDPYETALSYGSGGGRVPVRYMLGEDAVNRSGITFGDSLRGAPAFDSFSDFMAALNRGGYNEIMSTPGRANWGWGRSNKGSLNIPEYIEAQIPGLSIDDVTKIIGSGKNVNEAAERAIDIADLVSSSGRNIPVGALSESVPPRPKLSDFNRETLESLTSNPVYDSIRSSLRNQRFDFVPSGMDDVINRSYMRGGAYQRPDWAENHSLNKGSQSAVMSALRSGYQSNVRPRLDSIRNFLFPDAVVMPEPTNPFGRPRTMPAL